ncbi:MAG: spore coat protein U domain-containing protein [Myxococcaceae bacterium]
MKIFLLILGCLSSTSLWATLSCSFSNTALDFGNVNLLSNAPIDAMGTLGISCSGGAAHGTVTVCIDYNGGSGGMDISGDPRSMLNGSSALQYNIFTDHARSVRWGSSTIVGSNPESLHLTLDSGGHISTSVQTYGRIYASQTLLPIGSYSSMFSGGDTRVGYSDTYSNCTDVFHHGHLDTASFSTHAHYAGSCTISTNPIAFGTLSRTQHTIASTTFTVTCSNLLHYTIGLNHGTGEGVTDPAERVLTHSNGHTITYGLYHDASHTQPWGDAPTNRTGLQVGTGYEQNFTVYGKVPLQTNIHDGHHSDTVTILVHY